MHALLLLLCGAGFACLALAMERHQRDVLGRSLAPASSLRWRLAGWGLLLMALGVAIALRGLGLGLALYSGHTSVAAGVVVLALVAHARC